MQRATVVRGGETTGFRISINANGDTDIQRAGPVATRKTAMTWTDHGGCHPAPRVDFGTRRVRVGAVESRATVPGPRVATALVCVVDQRRLREAREDRCRRQRSRGDEEELRRTRQRVPSRRLGRLYLLAGHRGPTRAEGEVTGGLRCGL